MINRTLANRIAAALARTAPNDVADVLSRCTEKGTIPMQKKRPSKWLAAACFTGRPTQ